MAKSPLHHRLKAKKPLGITLESSSKVRNVLRMGEEKSVEDGKAVEEENLRDFEEVWEEEETLF